jgi:hypothetical protein
VATSAALVDANRELADARLNLANEAERERRRILAICTIKLSPICVISRC